MKIKFSKMFKGNISFYERNKLLQKTWTLNKRKINIKKKGKVHVKNFLVKEKGDIKDFWE